MLFSHFYRNLIENVPFTESVEVSELSVWGEMCWPMCWATRLEKLHGVMRMRIQRQPHF